MSSYIPRRYRATPKGDRKGPLFTTRGMEWMLEIYT